MKPQTPQALFSGATHTSVARWLVILLSGGVGAIWLALVTLWRPHGLESLVAISRLGEAGGPWAWPGATALFIAAVFCARRLARPPSGASALRFFLAWPPTWVAVGIAFLIHGAFDPPPLIDGLAQLLAIAVLAFPFSLGGRTERGRDQAATTRKDLLASSLLAEGLADYLTQGRSLRGDKEAWVSVLGARGAGKTFLLDLVEETLAKKGAAKERIEVVRFDCWGYAGETPLTAELLRELWRRIESATGSTPLTSLSAPYLSILGGDATTAVQALEKMFSSGEDAQSVEGLSSSIEAMLECLGIRIVLLLEELERTEVKNGGTFFATLCRLRRVERISGVMAFDPAGESLKEFDWLKLCDRVEFLHPLSPPFTSQFLEARLGLHKGSDSAESSQGGWVSSLVISSRRDDIAAEIAALSVSPRLLSAMCRRFEMQWQTLQGEIDFDDMLVACAIREIEPLVFQNLLWSWDSLVGLRKVMRIPGVISTDSKDDYEKLLNRICNGCRNENVRQLVRRLDVAWQEKDFSEANRIQRLRDRLPTDYLQRFLRGSADAGEVRDQAVQQMLRSWKQGERGALLDAFVTADSSAPELPPKWAYFAGSWSAADRLTFAGEVMDRLLARDGARVRVDHPALQPLLDHLRKRGPEAEVTIAWLKSRIATAIQTSLYFAEYLYEIWAHPFRGIMVGNDQAVIRDFLAEAARRTYAEPARLAKTLTPLYPMSLATLIAPGVESEAHALRQPEDWAWLAPVLVDGLKEDPELRVFVEPLLDPPDAFARFAGGAAGEIRALLAQHPAAAPPKG
jgi:hypothetical protein